MRVISVGTLSTLVFAAVAACSSPDEPQTSTGASALTQENGIWENGLTTNGIWENGIWENGIWENGIWENGIWENGIWENGLWQANPTALGTLRTNAYTRKVMQYVFSCAVPAGRSKIIDPGRTGACVSNPAQACVHDADCGTDGICLGGELELKGAIGVGINDGAPAATWDLPGGTCDASCQRWVSACLLSRTNAYGVHVHISMRAPDDAPQPIKDALATTQDERSTYSHREGTYYGNIFATGAIGDPVQLYACAGPESNVPEITNRFCSSAGDDGPIDVIGSCLTAGQSTGVCGGEDTNPASSTFGGIRECHGHNGAGPYKETITVFLADPISVCGNNVCERDEEAGQANDCPSDCHPGTWGNSVPSYVGASALAPDDSIIRVAVTNQPVDMGGGVLPATGNTDIVVARYSADGAYAWSKRLSPGITQYISDDPEVIVAPTGEIYVLGRMAIYAGDNPLWVVKLTANGDLIAGWPKFYGGTAAVMYGTFPTVTNGIIGIQPSSWVVGTAADGSLFVAGRFIDTIAFGSYTVTAPSGETDAFLAKLTPNGGVAWAKNIGHLQSAQSLYVDPSGDVWMTAYGTLVKRSGATGDAVLTKTVQFAEFGAVRLDSAGNVYVTGAIVGNPCVLGQQYTDQTFFVASYTPDAATLRWSYVTPQTSCEILAPDCNVSYMGYRIGFDKFGNVVVGGMGGGQFGGTVDMGAGPFTGYGTMDIYFVALNTATGAQRWTKHVPLILDGVLTDVTFTNAAKVVMSGVFAGSMLADGKLLVSSIPEDVHTYNGFLASFDAPAPDVTPPVIAHVPHDITLAAWKNPNGEVGAVGWYMPPTATDASNGGTNVHCDHRSTEFLPIGTTTVHCTAYDAFGNQSQTSFRITVKDLAGPKFSNVPGDIQSAGPHVTYTTPNAVDALDGVRPVSCVPASGSTFPEGNTTVTCSASDLHGNTSYAHFVVTVHDATPPVIGVPSSITAEATGPTGAVVTYSATATDNVDGAITPTCTPASGSTFALGTTTVTCSATDAAGNEASASFTVTVRDTTPPVVTVPSTITVTATSASGNIVTYASSAYDLVDGGVATTCTPASGSLFALGNTTVTCTATDSHGNTGSASFVIQVQVSWGGILQPINADGSSIFKLGRTVPVKFQLTGASAGITDLVANLSLVKISNGVEGTETEAISTAAADTGNTFRYDPTGQLYIFNLATAGLSTGTWRLKIDLHDGVTRTVDISLRP